MRPRYRRNARTWGDFPPEAMSDPAMPADILLSAVQACSDNLYARGHGVRACANPNIPMGPLSDILTERLYCGAFGYMSADMVMAEWQVECINSLAKNTQFEFFQFADPDGESTSKVCRFVNLTHGNALAKLQKQWTPGDAEDAIEAFLRICNGCMAIGESHKWWLIDTIKTPHSLIVNAPRLWVDLLPGVAALSKLATTAHLTDIMACVVNKKKWVKGKPVPRNPCLPWVRRLVSLHLSVLDVEVPR